MNEIRITSITLRRTESFEARYGNEQYGLTADVAPGQSVEEVRAALTAEIDAHFDALGLGPKARAQRDEKVRAMLADDGCRIIPSSDDEDEEDNDDADEIPY